MELTYSAQTTDFDPDKRYRNPQYFDKPETGVTKVTVVGDWPVVVEVYKAVQAGGVPADGYVGAGESPRNHINKVYPWSSVKTAHVRPNRESW